MKFLDPKHPFFRPPVVRYGLVCFTFLWASFEQWNGNAIWALIFAAIGGVLAWQLIWTYQAPEDDGD